VSQDPSPPETAAKDPVEALLLKGWRAFKSIKTGILLLCVIGAACVYGTMFYAANSVLGDQAIPLAKARVFNAWWFFALMGLFFVQFVISTWHVTKMSCTIWWKRDFSKPRDFVVGGAGRGRVAAASADDVAARLARAFTRAHREGTRFFAHRGLRARLGPTIIHLGIVVILLSSLGRILLDRNGKILSEGRFIAAEGETSSNVLAPIRPDQAIGPDNVRIAVPNFPYEITVLDFDKRDHPNSNEPAYFSSLLKVRDARSGDVRVAKLDMNHSLSIDGLEFHQAGYQPLPPIQTHRTDYDVRDARTGERIAVADASPGTRVQVQDEDLFLEVDGEAPGDAWRLYSSDDPRTPVATGSLLAKARPHTLRITATEFFPDFRVREENGEFVPFNGSDEPNNPALRVALVRDGSPTGDTWLFLDEQFAKMMPAPDSLFAITLSDVRVPKDAESVDWAKPGEAIFVVNVAKRDGTALGETPLLLGQATSDITIDPDLAEDEAPPTGAAYAIYPMGRSLRFVTILTVMNEPTVPFNLAGVTLIAFGALLTFTGRYRALYGHWNEEERVFEFALIPRFGKATPQEVADVERALGGEGEPAPSRSNEVEAAVS